MQNKKKLGVQMGWIIAVSIGVLTVILAGFGYMSFQNTFRRFYSDKAQSTAKMIADMVDGDRIGTYLETGKTDAYYEELQALLADMKRDSGAEYLYLFYPEEDHFTYILDAREETER